ncbi:MAG: C39 family peptidase [Thermomicrobiales bacterium]|nr:C39 family peptidase [Thermomicrobiales bacterium]
MTIVLGRRPAATPTATQQRREQWVQHFRDGSPEPEQVVIPTVPVMTNGLAPVPVAEIRGKHRGIYASNKRRRAAAPNGVVGLYASRLDAQSAGRLSTISAQPRIATNQIGRGSRAHYETLYPSKNLELRIPEPSLPLQAKVHETRGSIIAKTTAIIAWRPQITVPHISFTQGHRLANSKRALYASMAALVLMVGMATSTLAASQYRYEVQEGDTLDSIAAEFGVDPEAIYRSSYMPYGYDVTAGQIIVIPEEGQSPADAAQMAAENEGTSPWAVGAHTVAYGDTFDSVAAAWGVPVDHLIAFNPDLDPQNLIVGQHIIIPWERDTNVARPQITAQPIVMLDVPNYVQTRNLSCEYAATHAATTAFGTGIDEQVFIDTVPSAANPHYGYRGNIDGYWGNTDDYGVYAEALVPVLNAHGYVGEVFYSEGDTTELIAQLDAGHPVVTWLGFWGDTRERLDDDGTYSVFSGMHVVTVVGYDELGVYVMDPAHGVTQHYDWDTFTAMWSVVDGMSMAVYPM